MLPWRRIRLFDSYELRLPLAVDEEAAEVLRAKERDSAAWACWYDRYYPLLYRYALARTGRREEAEDIAAQAFVRALEGIDKFDYRGRPVLAWLYRITHNLVTDRVRRDKRRPAVRLDDVSHVLQGADSELPRLEVIDALNRLKADQRDVLVLRYMVAMPAREIAAIMGKTESAVYSLQVRAIANLRKAFFDN